VNQYIKEYIKLKYNNDVIDRHLQYYRRIKKYPREHQKQFTERLKATEELVRKFVLDNPKALPRRMATFNAMSVVKVNESRLAQCSEAVTQCELYGRIKGRLPSGYRVVPELKVEDCRFDLAIINELSELVLIIELKRTENLVQKFLRSTQFTKYARFGVPIYSTSRYDCNTVPEILSMFI
jgi:hypothetical protein